MKLIGVLALAAQLSPAAIPHFTKEGVAPRGRHPQGLMPGDIIELYGEALAPWGCAPREPIPPRGPYPKELCGTSVLVAGKPAGLLYAGPTQINLQIPEDAPKSGSAPIQVLAGDARSDTVMCDFGKPKTKLALIAPARVRMPVWIEVERPSPYDIAYPNSRDPWNFGGGRFEVTRNGVPLEPWKPGNTTNTGGIEMSGLVNGSSAPEGAPRSRLPLHLAYHFDQPGKYAVRFTGFQFRLNGGGLNREQVDESDWLEFEVAPYDAARHDKWIAEELVRMAKATPGELVGDILPSLLTSADEALIPRILEATYYREVRTKPAGDPLFEGELTHGEQMVQGYAIEALRAFDIALVRKYVTKFVRESGPSVEIARRVGGERSLFNGSDRELAAVAGPWLKSTSSTAQAGALQVFLTLRNTPWGKAEGASVLDGRTLDAADSIIRHGDAQSWGRLAQSLGLIHDDRSRELLWRMVEGGLASGQALICVVWIGDARDLPRLGAILAQEDPSDPYGYKKTSLVGLMSEKYGDAAVPYFRTALKESKQLWVRKDCAEQLALRGEPAGFAGLLQVMEQQASARPEILEFARRRFAELNSAGEEQVVAFLRARARR